MNSREGARKPAQKNQQAPGRLEVLRAFLNTWRIPNDTRVATDHLREDEDVRSFRDAHFGPDIAAEPKEEVVRLREDLRNHLGKGDVAFLNRWLEKYPVTACIRNGRVHYGGAGASAENCWLWPWRPSPRASGSGSRLVRTVVGFFMTTPETKARFGAA